MNFKIWLFHEEKDNSLDELGHDLNSVPFEYRNKSGQNPTERMYVGNGGFDLTDQEHLNNLRIKYKVGDNQTGRALNQISFFTSKNFYNSDIINNRVDYPELHYLISNAPSHNNPSLHRAIVLQDVVHGELGKPLDVKELYKIGDIHHFDVSSTSSDPELARHWVLDDKRRIEKAIADGDMSVLDKKYNGARNFAYVNHHFPPSSQALQLAPFSEVPEQNEYALASNKFKIIKVSGPDHDGIYHVYWERDN